MISSEVKEVRALYLSAMVRILTNTIYEDDNINPRRASEFSRERREEGKDWPKQAFTMIGVRRLENVRRLAELVVINDIPGDFIEAGVWRGGACIMMRAVLAAYGDRGRNVFCADSFQGLPQPDAASYPKDAGDKHHTVPQLAVSRSAVEQAFAKFDLLDEQTIFLEGFFKETLPTLHGCTFSLIRLDGDMYESTMQGLENLYPRLSPGGYVIIDDYGAVPGCKEAVTDFRAANSIGEPLQTIDWTGRWWRKGGND